MKVENMTNSKGNEVPNQFIIWDDTGNMYFQSYDVIIVKCEMCAGKYQTLIDEKYWDYSVTTGKYRNLFLGETKKETQRKIDSGEYILTDLN